MVYGHGLTASERRVIDPFDAGATPAEIANSTGIPIDRVLGVISLYGPLNSTRARSFEDASRRSTAALLEAISRHHPDRITGAKHG